MPEKPGDDSPLRTAPGAVQESRHAAPTPVHDSAGARSAVDVQFFASVADGIVRDISPGSALDVGCAMGVLVEALAARGVDARGIDVSEEAISRVRADIADRCEVRHLLEPFGRRYDLVTCIDVGEHLRPADAQQLILNICTHCDDVIFASNPWAFADAAHVNVRPPEYWAELFAQNGFHRDLLYDASYVAPWAMRFRRATDPLPRLVREYERELWRARNEAHQRNELMAAMAAELEALRPSDARDEANRLSQELAAQQRLLLDTYEMLRQQEEDLRKWRESGAGRLAYVIQRGTNRLAPPGTIRQRGLNRLVRSGLNLGTSGLTTLRRLAPEKRVATGAAPEHLQAQYDRWRELHDPKWTDLNRMRHDNRVWQRRPLISVILPTYNPRPELLHRAIASVLEQVYENWELCIADDASTHPGTRQILQQYADADSRVRFVVREKNGGISAASASALGLATGEFIALLDHDDELRPHALHRVVEHLQTEPATDVLYSDEDLLFSDGTRGGPHFKPDWSPDLLMSVNYMCHLLVARRELVESVGGFREGFDGAQDHDLALRLTERARRVGHVADILYSWRQAPGSVAADPTAKMYAYEAGRRAVEDALRRSHTDGVVTVGDQLGTYHARRVVREEPAVAIVIPTRDRVQLLRECIRSVEETSTYRNWTITIVDNGSVEHETLEYFARTPHSVVHKPGHFNYSRLMNFGRANVTAPYLLMLNNDIVTVTPNWIEALLEHAQREEVGAVGARLVYPDGRVQHEGIGLGNVCSASTAVNLDAGWMGRVVRDVAAVTGACQMVRTTAFDAVDGYDETLQVAYNDVDFCLRLRATGRLVVYTPHAELRHREGATRGGLNPLADQETFWRRWGAHGGLRDPYINPHLRSLNPVVLRLGPMPSDRLEAV